MSDSLFHCQWEVFVGGTREGREQRRRREGDAVVLSRLVRCVMLMSQVGRP